MTNSNLLDQLLAQIEDKEAAAVWGPLAKQLQEDEGDRPRFAKRSDIKVRGTVVRVYQRENFDKDGMDPAVDLETGTGTVIVTFGSTVLKKAAVREMPQKGDTIEVVYAQAKTKGRYYDDKLTVIREGGDEKVPF